MSATKKAPSEKDEKETSWTSDEGSEQLSETRENKAGDAKQREQTAGDGDEPEGDSAEDLAQVIHGSFP